MDPPKSPVTATIIILLKTLPRVVTLSLPFMAPVFTVPGNDTVPGHRTGKRSSERASDTMHLQHKQRHKPPLTATFHQLNYIIQL